MAETNREDEFELFQRELPNRNTDDLDDLLQETRRESSSNINALLEMMIRENQRRDDNMFRLLSKMTNNEPSREFQIMPDLTKSIKTYDGQSKVEATEWLNNLKSMMTLHKWPESFVLETARTHLIGGAKFWMSRKQQELTTFTAFEDAFSKTFIGEVSRAERWRSMEYRVQGNNEPLSRYFHEKTKLCVDLGLNFLETREQVLIGLHDKTLCDVVSGKAHIDEDDLLHSLEDYQRIHQRRVQRFRDSRKDPSKTENTPKVRREDQQDDMSLRFRNRTVNQGPSALWNQRSTNQGRTPSRNEEGKPLCFKCHRYGHVAKYCRSLQGSERSEAPKVKQEQDTQPTMLTQPFMKVNYSNNDSNLKYFKEAKVNDHSVEAYVDQGSRCVLLRQKEADEMKLEYSGETLNTVITGYGAGEVRPVGRTTIELEVDEAQGTCEAVIVPTECQGVPLIIGQPFTEQPHVTIVRRRHCLRLFNEPIEQDDEHEEDITSIKIPALKKNVVSLWAQKTVLIPPHHVGFVTLNTRGKGNGDLFIESNLSHGKSIPRCIVTVDENNEVVLPINNDSRELMTIKQGERVLRAQSCESFQSQDDEQQFMESTLYECTTADERCQQIIEQCDVGQDVINDPETTGMLRDIIQKHHHAFALHVGEIGCCQDFKAKIELNDDRKIVYRPYRLSYAERGRVRDQLAELKDANIIEDSDSEYASPMLIVRKKNGEERICIDYRQLNKITKEIKYPLPLIEDQINRLDGMNYFTSLDMKSGYYQIPLHDDSKDKTAFVTPDGHFQFTRMPFGIVNGPALFQKMINQVVGTLRYTKVLVYFDDILIPSKTLEEGMQILEEILTILERAHLTLNPKKCSFFCNSIEYLGYKIEKGKIMPGETKMKCIQQFPKPQNVHNIRQFLGLTSYFRRFVPKYGILSKPLTQLLKQGEPWIWGQDQEDSFITLKEKLTTEPVLQIYSPCAKTEVHTDASSLGLAGILMQEGLDNCYHPVFYVSRQTTREESRYHSSELETLAVVWTCSKLRVYLVGRRFKLVTDCNSLRSAFAKKDVIPRIGRWLLKMQEFEFTIEHRPGESMKHVDAMSRNPFGDSEHTEIVEGLELLQIEELNVVDWITLSQRKDLKIRELAELLKKKRLNNEEQYIVKDYVLQDGRVYRKMDNNILLVIPKNMRWRILQISHDDMGHPSLDRTIKKIFENFWFPRVRHYARSYIGACIKCLYYKCPGGRRPGKLHPIDKIGRPFHTIHMDHLGPFVKSSKGNQHLIVAIDGFTKFVEMKAVPDTTSRRAANFLKEITNTFGPPERVITDQGTAYTGKPFETFCKEKNIKHILNATSTPRANGQVERLNRYITPALASLTTDEESRDWDQFVGQLKFGINNTYHAAIKTTPFSLLFNFRPRSYDGNPLVDDQLRFNSDSTDVETRRREAFEHIQEGQRKQQMVFDQRRGDPKAYQVGDLVVVRRNASSTGTSRKLIPKYAGPYMIVAKLPNDRYYIEDVPETQRSQKFYKNIVAVDAMKKYDINQTTDSDESNPDEDDNNENQEDLSDEDRADKDETQSDSNVHQQKTKESIITEEADLPQGRRRRIPDKLKDYILN